MSEEKTYSGYNPQVKLEHFSDEEKKIIHRLSGEWYVTNGGGEIKLGPTSLYKYFLVKPTDLYKEMFDLELEIVCVFSNYSEFETRTLDAYDYIFANYQQLRLERLCFILISKDEKITQKIDDLVKHNQESQIVIPLSYYEILNKFDSFLIRNRFKKFFYSRDLFAFESPLKKDFYFFGRTNLIQKIVSRHRSNENSALFGLRKSGKTSLIFGIKRKLADSNYKLVFIDCQSPAIHLRKWNFALYYLLQELKNQYNLNFKLSFENQFKETDAPILFENGLLAAQKENPENKFVFVFDEIENITFGTSPTKHWTDENDFILFWQTLRHLFQKHDKLFSYIIVGTNPRCIETPIIHKSDNPIFNQVYFEYIPPFDVPQTREMVRKLGRIMGLQFDEIIYSKLTEDFGGHPFLIRHVCSVIHKISSSDRPIRVNIPLYNEAKKKFKADYSHFIEMILSVLKQYYPNEFDMLKYIALDDIETFNGLAELSNEFTSHLIGYNIVDYCNSKYSFNIEAIKDYLLSQHKYEKALNNVEDRIKEISERRNYLEPKLRKVVKTQLVSSFGKGEATKKFLDVLGEPRKTKYAGAGYNDLFNSSACELYFEDLRKIIVKHYDIFKNIFGANKDDIDEKLKIINKYRADAHAKTITKEEMDYFRVSITTIEEKTFDFIE